MIGDQASIELFSLPDAKQDFLVRENTVDRVTKWGALSHEEQLPSALAGGDSAHGAWWKAQLAGGAASPNSRRGLSAVDLFSGSGGFASGFSSGMGSAGVGVNFLAAVDLDANALQVHQLNHGTRALFDKSVDALLDYSIVGLARDAHWLYEPEIVDHDFRSLKGKVDVVLAGPPCQGNSNLNNRTRHTDERNRLYLTVPAVAVALDAPTVVIENVPGVVHDRSQVVQTTIALLEKSGYWVTYGTVHATRLGWPQTRKRFFLVASKLKAPIDLGLLEQANSRETLDLRWAIEELADVRTDELLDGSPGFSDANKARMSFMIDADAFDMPNAIRPLSHRDGTTYKSSYGRLNWSDPAPTITTGFVTPGRGRFIHPDQPRTLTAREAARIQGFSDHYFRRDVLERSKATRGLLAKWIGDAVPLPLGELTALSLLPSFTDAY